MSSRQSSPDVLALASAALAAARSVVVLTGAGISAESGVPVFRGSGGLWRDYRPEDLATPEAFARSPRLVWEWYRWRRARIAEAAPNPGHHALVRLERRARQFVLLTQNVDGLHREAGSQLVRELHGNIWHTVCARGCGLLIDESPWSAQPRAVQAEQDGVPLCRCGAPMRPGVVWFGEPLDPIVWRAAADAAAQADVMLVVGTSALVQPAAALPLLTVQAGGAVIEVNLEDTPLSAVATFVLRGTAGELCPALEAPR